MIIPSIDIMNGNAVQLVGGRRLEIDAGDPRPIMESFRMVGEVAVIDLDAALGRGSNAELIAELCRMGPCRVGGGIRDEAAAAGWLDAGAARVILGTAARPDVLANLPADRVIAALDARDGRVVYHGWTRETGATIDERMAVLQGLVGGFLITTIEREGRLGGADLALAERLVAAAGPARLTLAGGVCTAGEVARLDRLGCDAQVGMALYSGRMLLADAVSALSTSDRPDGLIPTVIVDERGVALGLAHSDPESLRRAIAGRRGIYRSRSRGIWVKGETSGDTQELLRVDWDCDRDCLRFTVRQRGRGHCHQGTRSCWGPDAGLGGLERRIAGRIGGGDAPDAPHAPDPASYSARLLREPALLEAKLREELEEFIAADGPAHAAEEAADVLYFLSIAMRLAGVRLAEVERVLDGRAGRITRRPGQAKPAALETEGAI